MVAAQRSAAKAMPRCGVGHCELLEHGLAKEGQQEFTRDVSAHVKTVTVGIG